MFANISGLIKKLLKLFFVVTSGAVVAIKSVFFVDEEGKVQEVWKSANPIYCTNSDVTLSGTTTYYEVYGRSTGTSKYFRADNYAKNGTLHVKLRIPHPEGVNSWQDAVVKVKCSGYSGTTPKPKIGVTTSSSATPSNYQTLTTDDWCNLTFNLTGSATYLYLHIETGKAVTPVEYPEGSEPSTVYFDKIEVNGIPVYVDCDKSDDPY